MKNTTMRTADQLGRDELLRIVQATQELLYLDLDESGTRFWNPDKPWDGADVCQDLSAVLEESGNVPSISTPWQEPDARAARPRYVLYDFGAGNLATTSVYGDYPQAADAADRLDNVMVVSLIVPAGDQA
jgi:hypothetical protein